MVSSKTNVVESSLNNPIDYSWRIAHSDGHMNIMLGGVSVLGRRTLKSKDIYETLAMREMSHEDIDNNRITSLEEALRKIPGLIMSEGKVTFSRAPVEFWVDGLKWKNMNEQVMDINTNFVNPGTNFKGNSSGLPELKFSAVTTVFEDLGTIKEFELAHPIHTIKKIQFFHPTMLLLFSVSSAQSGGVLLFTTKDGSENYKKVNWNYKIIHPLGYQKKKTIYIPKYEFFPEEEMNARPTLYWIPRAEFDDKGQLVLPLPSTASEVYVAVEGIAHDGIPISYRKKIK